MSDANSVDRELARMADTYAEIGLYGKATAALNRVKDATAITVITRTAAVAKKQASFGDFAGARKTASMIRDDSFRVDAFGKIAVEQAGKGDAKGSAASLQTAVKGVGGSKDGTLSRNIAMAWTGVANALVKAGKMQEAKEALKKAQDAFKNAPASEANMYIQVQIGKVQAVLLQTDAARTTADSIKHPGWKATVLQAAAQEQAKSGKAAAAYGWAGKLGQPFERGAALTGVAMGLLEQGTP
jgi:tetratricopeptide (TPR) repeat protein